MSAKHSINNILAVLTRCYEQMEIVFLLPVLLRREELPRDLTAGPQFEKLVRICATPFSDDNKDLYDYDELIDFVKYWCSNSVAERLAKCASLTSENTEHLLGEFKTLIRMVANSRDEAIDFDQKTSSDREISELHQRLLQMAASNQTAIAQLVDESTKKMEKMHVDFEVEEKKLMATVSELSEQLISSECAYEFESKTNQIEISKMMKLLRDEIDNYDETLSPVFRELCELNEKIATQQRKHDKLSETFADQVAFYERALAEEARIRNEKVKFFSDNRAAKIIQHAYRVYRVLKQKKKRKMKRNSKSKK